jgi:hypothetical protein
MSRLDPLFMSPMPTPAERAQLSSGLSRILTAHGHVLGSRVAARLLERLADATGNAKAGPDLASATARHRATIDALTAHLNGTAGPPCATTADQLPALFEQSRIQIRTAGRPLDLWKHALLRDVRRALEEADLPCYWKTEADTLLVDVFRECAKVAGHPMPGDLRGVWNGARRCSYAT